MGTEKRWGGGVGGHCRNHSRDGSQTPPMGGSDPPPLPIPAVLNVLTAPALPAWLLCSPSPPFTETEPPKQWLRCRSPPGPTAAPQPPPECRSSMGPCGQSHPHGGLQGGLSHLSPAQTRPQPPLQPHRAPSRAPSFPFPHPGPLCCPTEAAEGRGGPPLGHHELHPAGGGQQHSSAAPHVGESRAIRSPR